MQNIDLSIQALWRREGMKLVKNCVFSLIVLRRAKAEVSGNGGQARQAWTYFGEYSGLFGLLGEYCGLVAAPGLRGEGLKAGLVGE